MTDTMFQRTTSTADKVCRGYSLLECASYGFASLILGPKSLIVEQKVY